MTTEKQVSQFGGWGVLVILIVVLAGAGLGLVAGIRNARPALIVSSVAVLVVSVVCLAGFFTVEPNQGMVLLLFGKYVGTERTMGFRWSNPFYSRHRISLRARNFDGEKLKVNDKNGNPVEISAVVVWRVLDTAQAMFDVDDYNNYVHVQAESALRHVATSYAYDDTDGEVLSLRASTDEVSAALNKEIQERVRTAGVVIDEARINHLAYAQEIAHAMLQRQQAAAIISARQMIVEGAVGMVEMALNRLREQNVVDLDEERKANMVSNLLVVLCSDKATQPIVNAGSLY
jgi:regulator of protease activity HflC (stomatin/prohibitin superfamily)